MASRRDQLHSYQFVVHRVVSALVMREADAAVSPFRRLTGASFAGLMIAVLVAAGFGVYGLFKPGGNDSWKKQNAIVVEEETGAVYVYRNKVLHPVLNYTSALLIAGGGGDSVATVSRNSLTGQPRGNTLGIPNAPTTLPAADHITGTPWTLCSRPDHDRANNPITTTVLVVGQNPRGGRALGDKGMLVTDSNDNLTYLIWHEHRYHITDGTTVLGAMLWGRQQKLSVGAAWLTALPAGTDIGRITIDGRGEDSSAVAGGKVGTVYETSAGNNKQFYVAKREALAQITPMQAEILLGDPDTARAYDGAAPTAQQLSPATATAAKQDRSLLPGGGDAAPPATAPDLVGAAADNGVACAAYRDAGSPAAVLFDATVPPAKTGASTKARTSGGAALVDRVVVPAGHAAVVDAVTSADSPAGGLNLITDLGYRYPVPDRDVLSTLGYGSVKVVKLPASLVARIPQGPTLDPDKAKDSVAS